MSRILIVVAILSSAGLAHAGDSTWLICKGISERGKPVEKSHVVVSLLERRGADGGSRDLSVTLIKGVHVNTGEIVGKTLKDGDVTGKVAPLKLASAKGKPVFTGTGELAKGMKTFTLKGSIDFAFGLDAKPTMEPFTAKLTCEVLDDLAIGH
jgi:hypothetical protein